MKCPRCRADLCLDDPDTLYLLVSTTNTSAPPQKLRSAAAPPDAPPDAPRPLTDYYEFSIKVWCWRCTWSFQLDLDPEQVEAIDD